MTEKTKENRARKEAERQRIVNQINVQMQACTCKEMRIILKQTFSDLLMALGWYRGFNYVQWLETGWQQWCADGKPEDNTKYIGDHTLIKFY